MFASRMYISRTYTYIYSRIYACIYVQDIHIYMYIYIYIYAIRIFTHVKCI
jgi:hypothetical protein